MRNWNWEFLRKQALAALLCCALLTVGSALGEEAPEGNAPVEVDEFFRSMAGRISFTLPTPPVVFREEDFTAEDAKKAGISYLGWTDKVQLYCENKAGAEFHVHIADVAPAIQLMKEAHPGKEEIQYQLNAVHNLAQFYLNMHDGALAGAPKVGLARPQGDDTEENALPATVFSYQYPDAEGTEYIGKALIDGTLAVIMMGERDAENEALLQDMRPVTREEAEAFHQQEPETFAIGRLRVTFPVPPEKTVSRGYALAHTFTPDYAYLNIEHMELPLSALMGDMPPEEGLREFAEISAKGYQEEGVIAEYTVFQAGEGMFGFDAKGPEMPGRVRDLVRAYITMDGVYTINSMDTDMGRAFLDSIEILDAGEQ